MLLALTRRGLTQVAATLLSMQGAFTESEAP